MKDKIKQKKEEGFTIIEVLIVLAIAGLIILIVFLAVPALQRNSRNTQRNTDVSALGGAVSEYINNNNGKPPSVLTDFLGNAQTSFYSDVPADGEIVYDTSPASGDLTGTDSSVVIIYQGVKCTDAQTGNTSGASSRNIAAIYAVENAGSTPTSQCQEI